MRTISLIAAAALLAACGTTPVREDRAVHVAWHKVASYSIEQTCEQVMSAKGAAEYGERSEGGCHVLRAGTCHVWAPDVQNGDLNDSRLEALGHEMKRCYRFVAMTATQ